MDFAVQPISFNDLNSTQDSAERTASIYNHHKSATGTPSAQAAQAIPPAHDTVKLSITSQIQALKQKGASTVEIATKLGLSLSDVDQILHISPAVVASQALTAAALSAHR